MKNEQSLKIKMSILDAGDEVKVSIPIPGSKSTVPRNIPVT
jgi:hypothetical protein